jgi:uncharacterized phage infection (PIP) family protein YhgE
MSISTGKNPQISAPDPRMEEDSDNDVAELKNQLQRQSNQISQQSSQISELVAAMKSQLQLNQALQTQLATLQTSINTLNSSRDSNMSGVQATKASSPSPNPLVPNDPDPAPTSALSGSVVKELSKKVYTFPEAYKLTGPENYDQWLQAVTIMFRALGLPGFVDDPESVI